MFILADVEKNNDACRCGEKQRQQDREMDPSKVCVYTYSRVWVIVSLRSSELMDSSDEFGCLYKSLRVSIAVVAVLT